jgi:uncharacterized membrane protein
MKKVIKKELLTIFKLLLLGLLLVIVLVLSGEQLKGLEILILSITPYILYQIYRAIHRGMRRKKR